jgi:hypothetical protein
MTPLALLNDEVIPSSRVFFFLPSQRPLWLPFPSIGSDASFAEHRLQRTILSVVMNRK